VGCLYDHRRPAVTGSAVLQSRLGEGGPALSQAAALQLCQDCAWGMEGGSFCGPGKNAVFVWQLTGGVRHGLAIREGGVVESWLALCVVPAMAVWPYTGVWCHGMVMWELMVLAPL
jgi:hypothetical protein